MTWPPEDSKGITPARALLLVAFAVAVIHSVAYGSWISDDAGISFTYARNLAAGHGLVLNPGGVRVEGYSNPLWVFLLAPFFAAGLFDHIIVPKILGVVLTLAALEMLARVSRDAFGDDESILHALPSLLLAVHVPIVTYSVSGLENPLYVLLILVALGRYLREIATPGSLPFSALLFFLVAITRPEGAVYFAAAFAHRAGRGLWLRRADGIVPWTGVFIGAFGAYHLWHYNYFADLVPNTFYAKMPGAGAGGYRPGEQLLDLESRGWRYVLDGLTDHHLLIVLTASLIMLLWRPAAATVLVGFMTAGGILAAAAMGGDWMPQYRFLSPVFALSYLLLGGAVLRLHRVLRDRFGQRRIAQVVTVVLAAGAGLWVSAPSFELLLGGSRHLSVALADKIERGERFGELAASLGIEGGSLLDPDLGGTSYTSGLDLIDLAGLADVHIALHGWDPRFFGRYVFEERRPTFIHTHCFWSMNSDIHSYPAFQSDYVPIWERPCESACCPDALDGEYVRRDVFLAREPIASSADPVVFDGGVELVDVRPGREVASPGARVSVETFWRRSGEARGDPLVELSLTGADAEVTTEGRRFGHGLFPPRLWGPDETIREEWELRLPDRPSSGTLSIAVTVSGSARRTVGTIAIDRKRVAEMARGELAVYERLTAEDRLEDALAALEAACRIDPELTECRGELGAARIRRESQIWRLSGQLIERGDLEAASEMLKEAQSRFGRRGAIAERLAECSGGWYERGRELAAREDAFLYWGEASGAFARAIACDPSNSFALKALERSRARSEVWRRHGDRLAAAHAGDLPDGQVLDLLHTIQEEDFPAQVATIVSESPPIREALERDGSLGALVLLHDHFRRQGNDEALERVTARLHTIGSGSILIDGQLALIGARTEAGGLGVARFTWWFEVLGPNGGDLRMVLRAERSDQNGVTSSLDHFLPRSSRRWDPGAIVRHTHTALLRTGSYRFRFALVAGNSDPPDALIEMDPLDLSRPERSAGTATP